MADVFGVKRINVVAAQMVLHCWKGMEDKNDNTNGAGCRE